MSEVQSKELVIVGYGPAGLGASLAAYKSGLRGITAIDPSSRLGVGGLDGLDILSNSLGSDFTELLPALFPEAARIAPAIELSQTRRPVELTRAASLLDEVAKTAIGQGIVEIEPEPVLKVKKLGNGYQVKTPTTTFESPWLVLAPGGEEVLIDELASRNNETSPGSVFTSRDVLANLRNEDLDSFLEGRNQVAIVGDSHGAYSVADKLLRKYPGIAIDIFKLAPTKPFFESVEEAKKLGYVISSIDSICPETGYVNRFNGIRGSARELWFREQNGEFNGVIRSLYNVPLSEIDPDVAVVQATGYKPRRVPLFDEQDQPIDYVTSPAPGGFARIHEGSNGESLSHAFALGIAHSASDGTTVYQKQAVKAFEVLR